MKIYRWLIGILLVTAFLAADIAAPVPLYLKWLYPMLLACFLALLRLFKGPTTVDRAAAIKVISVLIISFCGILSLVYRHDIYMDIAIAWSIQAFIGTMVFAKYLEGRSFDD